MKFCSFLIKSLLRSVLYTRLAVLYSPPVLRPKWRNLRNKFIVFLAVSTSFDAKLFSITVDHTLLNFSILSISKGPTSLVGCLIQLRFITL